MRSRKTLVQTGCGREYILQIYKLLKYLILNTPIKGERNGWFDSVAEKMSKIK